jgi:periplasmic divalent cation tolerance protein
MDPSETEVRVGFITAPDVETGTRIARALVEERLAACVNLVPGIRSIYRWEGALEDDAEVLLVVKTRADRAGDLASRVAELHPYDLPEVVLLPAVGGSLAYLDWVRAEAAP